MFIQTELKISKLKTINQPVMSLNLFNLAFEKDIIVRLIFKFNSSLYLKNSDVRELDSIWLRSFTNFQSGFNILTSFLNKTFYL